MAHESAVHDLKRRFIKYWGFRALWILEWMIGRFSLVGDRPVHDSDTFAWTKQLEANWQVIREELEDVLRHREVLPNFQDISTDQTAITTDDRWKTYFLYGFGFKAEHNCARCPETTRLIEQVPGMTTAFFSILAPGKHIPEHRGPYKGVLRYHLGLIVPEPREACRIRVDDEIHHWEEGGSLLFDDTYQHEVWNDTDGERVVLFMDVKRPLRAPLAALNDVIIRIVAHSPYIQDAKQNFEQWEQRLDRVAEPVGK